MTHLRDPKQATTSVCGQLAGGAVSEDLAECDCQRCLWRVAAEVQNTLAVIMQRLYSVVQAPRVEVVARPPSNARRG